MGPGHCAEDVRTSASIGKLLPGPQMWLLFRQRVAIYQNRLGAARKWQGNGGVCWGDWMFKALMIRAIQGFVSYFSDLVSHFPLAYQSELIYEV